MPKGVTLAEYAHRGAYPLIVTALLAALFVIVTLRPGSSTAAMPAIRKLVVLWIAQNIVLVGSSIVRTFDYVEAYSLTILRISALAWMVLVAVGLVLTRDGKLGHAIGLAPCLEIGIPRVHSGREQDELFAFLRVGFGNDSVLGIGPDGSGITLDRRQRDHLAADLGKPLGAATDGDEALLIDSHDVASVVPPTLRRLQHAGRIRIM